jgi:hypothetical protein
VTVDVALNAPSSVTNVATVSGGSEVNTANDIAQDPTTILPPPHPDLAPFMNHSFNNFVQGQSGIYRIDISNVGTAITSGAVTVSDTLPAGLTATDMSGVGWTCSVATLSCTQSTPLQFNNSYAPIFLTVAIAANAPATVTNVATVSGGGDTNNANDSFSDLTQIAAPIVDLTPALSGTSFVSQGLTNVNFPIFIDNFGNIASSGTITVVANLSTGFTAFAISGAGWTCTLSTLTCTQSGTIAAGSASSQINLSINVANNAPSTGSLGVTVSGGGDNNTSNNTTTQFVNIQPMVSITPLQNTATITAGQPAQFSLLVNALPATGGPAALSCSGLPAASSCTFTPPSVPNNVGGAFVSLVISTTARSVAATVPLGQGNRSPLVFLLVFGLAVLMSIALRYRPTPQRKLAWGAAGTLLLLAVISGCGGSGGGTTQQVVTQQGTPAGTYPVTVTAATPNETVTTVMTLTVR